MYDFDAALDEVKTKTNPDNIFSATKYVKGAMIGGAAGIVFAWHKGQSKWLGALGGIMIGISINGLINYLEKKAQSFKQDEDI